jgi:hypothetical protein
MSGIDAGVHPLPAMCVHHPLDSACCHTEAQTLGTGEKAELGLRQRVDPAGRDLPAGAQGCGHDLTLPTRGQVCPTGLFRCGSR